MERYKTIILYLGMSFLVVLMYVVFSMKKGDKQSAVVEPQEEIQEMGCATQKTDLTEEQVIKSVNAHSEEAQETDRRKDEAKNNASVLTEYQAEQIIKEADNAIHSVMEEADINNKEQPEEEEVRAYLLDYFDQNILDYVLYVYQIKTEEDKCFYQYYDHYQNYYMDTENAMQITEQGESYCDINVTFVHRWERKWDEEKVTVRIEKNDSGRWVITEMNQWYNDFRFNYMREMGYEPVYLSRDMVEWMIREFGTDENGEKIQLCTETDGDGYILSDSSERQLTEQEIDHLSRYEIFLAVQEIYARNGKKFDDVMLYGYFRAKPWYEPYRQVFDENNLTETERYNISQLTAAGDLGELAKAAYGNRYGKEEKMVGQPMSTEEAACIIGDAFGSLRKLFTAKAENKIEEKSDGVEVCYSLGEYTTEGQLREYVSIWFSEDVFDYLMNMCSVMYGVAKDEDDQYVLSLGLTPPMYPYVLDDFSSFKIKDYSDVECIVAVPFQNLYAWPDDVSAYSEGEILLMWEGDRWIITMISEPHYDENFLK